MTATWKPGMDDRGTRIARGATVGAIALVVGIIPLLLIAEFALWSDGAAEDAIGYLPGISLLAVPYLAVPGLIVGALIGGTLAAIPKRPGGAHQAPIWLTILGFPIAMALTATTDLREMLAATPVICLTLWLAGRSWVKRTVVGSPDSGNPFSNAGGADPSRTRVTTLQRSVWVGALHGIVGTVAFNLAWMMIQAFVALGEGDWWRWTSALEHVFDTSVATSPFSIAFGAGAGALLFFSKRFDLAPIAAAGAAGAYLVWRMVSGRNSVEGFLLAAITVAIYFYLGGSFRRRVFPRGTDDGDITQPPRPDDGGPPSGSPLPAMTPPAGAPADPDRGSQQAVLAPGRPRYEFAQPDESSPAGNQSPPPDPPVAAAAQRWLDWWPLVLGLFVLGVVVVVFVLPVIGPTLNSEEEAVIADVQPTQIAERILRSASPDGGVPIAAVSPAHAHLCGEDTTRQIARGWSLDSSMGSSARSNNMLETLKDDGYDVRFSGDFSDLPPFAPLYVFAAVKDDVFVDTRLRLLRDGDELEVRIFHGECVAANADRLVASALAAD